jgi:hypothetical protein
MPILGVEVYARQGAYRPDLRYLQKIKGTVRPAEAPINAAAVEDPRG